MARIHPALVIPPDAPSLPSAFSAAVVPPMMFRKSLINETLGGHAATAPKQLQPQSIASSTLLTCGKRQLA